MMTLSGKGRARLRDMIAAFGLAASVTAAGAAVPLAARAADLVTLHFWAAWDPSLPDARIAQDKIKAFEAAHPDIKIDVQVMSFGAMHDKLVTAIAGGQPPDVSWGLSEWLGELNRMGALADLTDEAKNWPDRDALYPNALSGLTIDGHLMALPHYLGIRGLLYHADMLKQAGIDSPPTSWDELVADAAKIHDKTGKYGFAVANDTVRAPQEIFTLMAENDVPLAEARGKGKFINNWNTDKDQLARMTQVLGLYKTMLEKGAIAPNATAWGWEEEDNNFALGQYAMVMDGSWMHLHVPRYPDSMKDVRIAPPPKMARAATYFEINPIYVYKGPHAKQAWTFASYLDSKDYQAAARPADSPRKDVQGTDMWGTEFAKLADIGVNFPPVALGQISRDLQEAIGRVLLRKQDPEIVAKWLGKAINKDLRQSGELASS